MSRLTAFLLVALVAAPAWGRGKRVLIGAAKHLYERGVDEFAEGQYEAASRTFAAALELEERPSLHYNLACALEKLGRTSEALSHYRAYLVGDPEAEDRNEVAAIIGWLAAERRSGEIRNSEDPEALAVQPLLPTAVSPDAAEAAPAWATAPPAEAQGRIPAYLTWAAAGAAALTAGWFGMQAMDAAERFERATVTGDTTAERERLAGLRHDARSQALVADLAAVAALTATGLGTWLFLSSASPDGAAGDTTD